MAKVKQGSSTGTGQLYTRCQLCSERAQVVTDWKPGRGYDQNLRQFKCKWLHITYKNLSRDVLFSFGNENLIK